MSAKSHCLLCRKNCVMIEYIMSHLLRDDFQKTVFCIPEIRMHVSNNFLFSCCFILSNYKAELFIYALNFMSLFIKSVK